MHLVITGLVQGVGFRYFVYRKASTYGLTGYVRNLPTGEVETKAFGDRAMLEALLADTRIGPRSAMVRDVRVAWLEKGDQYMTFELR